MNTGEFNQLEFNQESYFVSHGIVIKVGSRVSSVRMDSEVLVVRQNSIVDMIRQNSSARQCEGEI